MRRRAPALDVLRELLCARHSSRSSSASAHHDRVPTPGENMTDKIRCVLVTKSEAGQKTALAEVDESALNEGDVTIAVTHSTLNYKDGLAVTGSAPVVRKFPLIAGIDFAGHVLTSSDARFKAGDAVVANGWGMGETFNGGYATRAR